MQLSLTQIGEDVRQIDFDLEIDWLSGVLSGKHSSELRVLSGQRVQVHAQRMGLDVCLSAQCTLRLQTECSACLRVFELDVPVAFSLTLKPRPRSEDAPPEDLELSREELEECFYEGDVIDLKEILREQIILALPMYPRCSPECKGLCPQCGINLNEQTCNCQREEVDPRLVVLKTLTKNQ